MPFNGPTTTITFDQQIYWTRFISDLCKAVTTTTELTAATASITAAYTAAIAAANVATCEFRATRGTLQTIPNVTVTKVQYNTETFDTDSTYDNATNFRHTPNVAGKYVYTATVQFDVSIANTPIFIYLFKNGSVYSQGLSLVNVGATNPLTLNITDTVSMNGSTDFVEVYCSQQSGGNLNIVNLATYNKFTGCRISN